MWLICCFVELILLSHTGTVVPECFKDDKSMEINGKLKTLTLAVTKTPEPMATKFGVGYDVGDTYRCVKFHYDPIRGS